MKIDSGIALSIVEHFAERCVPCLPVSTIVHCSRILKGGVGPGDGDFLSEKTTGFLPVLRQGKKQVFPLLKIKQPGRKYRVFVSLCQNVADIEPLPVLPLPVLA